MNHLFDGTQTHHWHGLQTLSPAELAALEASLVAAAPARLQQGDCVHAPGAYRAYHRLQAFRRARIVAFGCWPLEVQQ